MQRHVDISSPMPLAWAPVPAAFDELAVHSGPASLLNGLGEAGLRSDLPTVSLQQQHRLPGEG